MSEEQIEIQLEPAQADAKPQQVVVEQADGASPPAQTEDAFDALQKQFGELQAKDKQRDIDLAASAAREREANDRAARAAQDAADARKFSASTEIQAVTNAISAAKAEADGIAGEYKLALESGDYTKATELQRKMARAEATVLREEERKTELERRPPPRMEQPRSRVDPLEAQLASFTPRTAAWFRQHPEVLGDEELLAKASWVDAAARKRGLAPDTDEYFRYADEQFGFGQQQRQADPPANTQETRARPMPAAPPSREASPQNGGGKVSVKLSPNEVKAATDGTLVWNTGPNKGKPIGVQEMARRKDILTKDGQYSRGLPQ